MGCGSSNVKEGSPQKAVMKPSQQDTNEAAPTLIVPQQETKKGADLRIDIEAIRDEMVLALLVCRNCEDPDNEIHEWCVSCHDDDIDDEDGVPMPVLCVHCSKGLHRGKESRKHKRVPFDLHTEPLKEASFYGYKEFPAGLPYLEQLLCHNCDSPRPERWCGSCAMNLCKNCVTELHAPAKMKSHLHILMSQRFVVAPVKHEENLAQLEKMITFAAKQTQIKDIGDGVTNMVELNLGNMLKQYKKSIMVKSTSPRGNPATLLGNLELSSNSPGDLFVVEDPEYTGQDVEQRQLMFQNIDSSFNVGNLQIVQLACGADHAGAVTTMGSLFMWGSNHSAQLGKRTGESSVVMTPIPVKFDSIMTLVKEVACGGQHTVCLTQHGAVFSWGAGLMGILGHPEDIDRDTPTQIMAFKKMGQRVLGVRAGENNSAAILANTDGKGAVAMWGEGSAGQIGNGDVIPQLTPVRIKVEYKGDSAAVIDLALGTRHVAALDQKGRVFTWGNNQFGECGFHSEENVKTPTIVEFLLASDVEGKQIAAGQRHCSLLDVNGAVWSWGSGETHQIGIMDNVDQWTPVRAAVLGEDGAEVTSISVGPSFSAAITEQGEMYLWGFSMECPIPKVMDSLKSDFWQGAGINSHGLIGFTGASSVAYTWDFEDYDEDSMDSSWPEESKALRGKRVASWDVGQAHGAVVTSGGQLYTWGDNKDQQLGIGQDEVTFQPQPKLVKTDLNLKFVRCGTEHNIALTLDNKVVTWGGGGQGRLGHIDNKDCPRPKIVSLLADMDCAHVAIGAENSAAVTTDGKLWVWGANNKGQIGNDDTHPAFEPILCSFFEGRKVLQVEFGLAEMVILVESKTGPDAANEVYTCGDNAFGQLGLGDYDSDMKKVPQLVTFFAMAGHSVISVCGGDNVLFAVTNKGEVFGWGCGETQQLGADKMDDQRIPVKIIFPSDPMSGEELYVYKMAANHINCAVVDRNGALFIWGYSFHDKPTIVSTLFDESIELTDVALGWGEMLLR